MTIQMLHSAQKITTAITDTKLASQQNSVQQRAAQAWQGKTVGGIPATQKNEPTDAPKFSAMEQSAIDEFIELLRTTQGKKALFGLLNKKLVSLSTAERPKFIYGVTNTLKKSELPEDKTLVIEKFNPAYSIYVANGMFASQLSQELFAKIGRVPNDDEEDYFDEI